MITTQLKTTLAFVMPRLFTTTRTECTCRSLTRPIHALEGAGRRHHLQRHTSTVGWLPGEKARLGSRNKTQKGERKPHSHLLRRGNSRRQPKKPTAQHRPRTRTLNSFFPAPPQATTTTQHTHEKRQIFIGYARPSSTSPFSSPRRSCPDRPLPCCPISPSPTPTPPPPAPKPPPSLSPSSSSRSRMDDPALTGA